MAIYSALLATGLVLGAPWWMWRMLRQGRYREGLGQRLGWVPRDLQEAVSGREVVWVHAVSVGEVLTAQRLVTELSEALGAGWMLVVSTTTAAGQKIARERFGAGRVFFMPLDLRWAVRAYLAMLRPKLLVLMESELWPRLLVECEQARVPVAVVNARVSDRSFPRYMRLRRFWRPLLGKVALFLAQGEETAARLRAIGVPTERVRVTGNLKYDAQIPAEGRVVEAMRRLVAGRKVVVAGSTLVGEEAFVLAAWDRVLSEDPETILVLAPRHPQRFQEVQELVKGRAFVLASSLDARLGTMDDIDLVLLDTVGDLAAVYQFATVAFVGGSLVAKGGHNPLEAARFRVPVVIGESYENFREIVEGMRVAEAIRIVSREGLAGTLIELLSDGAATGERGKVFYEAQAGATGRTVAALLELVEERG